MGTSGVVVRQRKARLRRAARTRRAAAFPAESRTWDQGPYLEAVAGLMAGLDQGAVVAVFRSAGCEPPTMLLLAFLRSRGMRVVVPLVSDAAGVGAPGGDRWVEWDGEGRDERGLLGSEVLGEVGAVIVPALAVGRDGVRLGQGGGWYDTALAHVRPEVPVLAMVNPDELHPAGVVPRETHDVPVDAVVLPSGIVWLGERG